jgi:hypothetical protein
MYKENYKYDENIVKIICIYTSFSYCRKISIYNTIIENNLSNTEMPNTKNKIKILIIFLIYSLTNIIRNFIK